MGTSEWVQFILLAALLVVSTPLAGNYMAKVYGNKKAPGDRFFGPIERGIYRVSGIDPEGEQRWTTYAISLLAFSAVSVLAVYAIQRLQDHLPLNPTHVARVPAFMSLNTAVSFVTNTDWQSYSPEQVVSHLTQMSALAVQNFLSAAVGLCVAVALIRGLARRRSGTIGSFWVDLVRSCVRILLPVSFVLAIVFLSQGVIDNFHGNTEYKPVDKALVQTKATKDTPAGSAVVPGGPLASQESIKEFGTNGGGFYNGNSGHPFENPNPFTNFLQMYFAALTGFGLTYTFGKMVGDQRQGWALFAVMLAFWVIPMVGAQLFETHGNPRLTTAGASQKATATNPGGNMEGKEVRFGAAASAMHGSNSTSTTTGSVNSSHDSWTPLGGGIVLTNILLGEYGPGGIGSGLYGILIMALVAVFIAGLMVGRTPEYLGKKIRAPDVKLATLYVLAVPMAVLALAAIASILKTATSQLGNTGPHGLTEIIYAYASGGNGNGSAFPGITVTSHWYELSLAMAILVGRFLLIVPVLAIAGGSARKQPSPPSAGTFPTHGPLFAGLLFFVILILVGLTYFPVLSLGPIVEHLSL
jgi:K+-transporting ATPase ATPase A chain